MKSNIHPNWHNDAVVTCSCGNSFITGSTQKTIEIDICDRCHPFFTGEMKFVDRQGRVDRFKQKRQQAEQKQAEQAKKRQEKLSQQTNQTQTQELTYQEILREKQSQLRTSNSQTKTSQKA